MVFGLCSIVRWQIGFLQTSLDEVEGTILGCLESRNYIIHKLRLRSVDPSSHRYIYKMFLFCHRQNVQANKARGHAWWKAVKDSGLQEGLASDVDPRMTTYLPLASQSHSLY